MIKKVHNNYKKDNEHSREKTAHTNIQKFKKQIIHKSYEIRI